MTAPLRQALCDHANGNYRILAIMAAEPLAAAARQELPQLDEKLYFEVFAQAALGSHFWCAHLPRKTAGWVTRHPTSACPGYWRNWKSHTATGTTRN